MQGHLRWSPWDAGFGDRLAAGGGDRRAAKLAGGQEALRGVLGHRAREDAIDLHGKLGAQLARRGRRTVQVRLELRRVSVADI